MNIKKEITLGIIFSLLVMVVVFLYIFQYQNRQKKTQTTQPAQKNSLSLTVSEVTKHNTKDDCWQIIENNVYNVADYLNTHPGGADIMIPYCGQDATQAFLTKDGQGSHSPKAYQALEPLKLGPLVK